MHKAKMFKYIYKREKIPDIQYRRNRKKNSCMIKIPPPPLPPSIF